MLTIIRFTRLTLCSGQTGTFMMIVLQLGLAMMPMCLSICLGVHFRHHQRDAVLHAEREVLSTTTAPAATAAGANSLLMLPPALRRRRS